MKKNCKIINFYLSFHIVCSFSRSHGILWQYILEIFKVYWGWWFTFLLSLATTRDEKRICIWRLFEDARSSLGIFTVQTPRCSFIWSMLWAMSLYICSNEQYFYFIFSIMYVHVYPCLSRNYFQIPCVYMHVKVISSFVNQIENGKLWVLYVHIHIALKYDLHIHICTKMVRFNVLLFCFFWI